MNACASLVFASFVLVASTSLAQTPPVAPPPAPAGQPPPSASPPAPAAGQPPPGAPQPLPGYAPPPGYPPYGYPPPGYAPPPGYNPYYPPPYYGQGESYTPRVIKWREGEEIPAGYHKGFEMRKDLIISGSVLFGSAWVPTAIASSFTIPTGVIPVIGPWIVIAQSGCGTSGDFDVSCGSGSGPVVFWLVFDGLQQGLGLGLLIGGLVAKRPVLLRNDVKEAKPWFLPVPMTFGPRSAGLGLAGQM
jgi:hypothetical protein